MHDDETDHGVTPWLVKWMTIYYNNWIRKVTMMMNIKKMMTIGLAMMTATVFLTGCGGDKAQKGNPTEMPKKIVIGLDDNFPPMGFKDKDGQLVGFDIDLAKETAKRLGVEVEFKAIEWASKEAELGSNRVDALWNGLSITEERKKNIDFSEPYMSNTQVIIVANNSPIQTKADLAGKVVAIQDGSTAVAAVEKEQDVLKSFKTLKKYGDNITALVDVEVGRADAIVVDSIVGRYYMTQKEGTFRVLDENFGAESFGVGVKKGNALLQKKINEAFASMKKDGTSAKISEKWFGKDITL